MRFFLIVHDCTEPHNRSESKSWNLSWATTATDKLKRMRRKCERGTFEGGKWEYNGEIREWRISCRANKDTISVYYIGIDRHRTVLLSGCVNRPIVSYPLIHLDELGHEARYFTFHDRTVSPDHVLVLGLGNEELRNHCQQYVLTLWDTIKNKFPFL